MEQTRKSSGWWWYVLFCIVLIVVIILIQDKRTGGQKAIRDMDKERVMQDLMSTAERSTLSENQKQAIIKNQNSASSTPPISYERKVEIINGLSNN